MYTSDWASAASRMSSLQRGWVDTPCSVGSRAWLCTDQLPGTALAVPEFGIRARRSLPGQEARASLNLLPDGCAIALTDPRAELLPKYWQDPRLLQQVARVIKPSGFTEPSRTVAYVFIHTSCLLCHTTLPVIESHPDIFYEINMQAIHISHCDPLQSRFFWKLIQIWDSKYVIANHFTALLVIVPLSHRQL